MFDSLDFKKVTTTGRATSNDPVSITHSFKTKKNEIMFRLSRDVMDKCDFKYHDKVHILFAADDTVCRIIKSDQAGAVTLSQQIKGNENSAGLVRLTYKSSLPNFLEKESKDKILDRVRYVHEDDKIQYDSGAVTFQLKLVDTDVKEEK